MRVFLFALLVLALPALAHAQDNDPTIQYVVAVFSAAATNPNTDTPVQTPVVYQNTSGVVTCGLPRVNPPPNLVNPTKQRFNDPANSTLDCEITIATQILALQNGTGLKTAVRAEGGGGVHQGYGAFGNSFNRARTPPPVPAGGRVL